MYINSFSTIKELKNGIDEYIHKSHLQIPPQIIQKPA
ncbi:MAG: hypothetical protein IE881_08095 [Epsilonproteobacteria bacterium]|nr:hypothetical protein [Campylobacterota bacterium]